MTFRRLLCPQTQICLNDTFLINRFINWRCLKMKRLFFLPFLVIALTITAFAQAPDTLWTRTYGGNNEEYGNSVRQTSDGGFIITGGTISYGAGGYDVYLIKTDGNGNESWTQTFGGNDNDYGRSVQQTTDGGYIITGSTSSFGANYSTDVWLIKTDVNGSETWTQTFGGNTVDVGYSVQQTSDGGYIIAGYTWSHPVGWDNVYLIKTDANGNATWSQTFGGNNNDYGRSVQQTMDGGYIIVGYSYSNGTPTGHYDVYMIKTDTNGNELWSQTFGESNNDYGYSVKQTTDGGYIIAGCVFSLAAADDVYLIKTDTLGNQQWSQTFGGSGYDSGYSVQQTTDGGYIIAGSSSSYGAGCTDVYIIKTDANGNEQWTGTFGGDYYDYGYDIQQTTDGGYIIAGKTNSYGAGYRDVWLIRLESELSVEDFSGFYKPCDFTLHRAFANPFNAETVISYKLQAASNVKLAVYDIAGREVAVLAEGFYPAGHHSMPFDASGMASGVYFARLSAGECSQTRKLTLLK